jgi:hypothetical protein
MDYFKRDNPRALALRLGQVPQPRGDQFQLNVTSFSTSGLGYLKAVTYDKSRPMMLICDGLNGRCNKLDIQTGLFSGLIELVDPENNEILSFEKGRSGCYSGLDVPPQPSSRYHQVSADLKSDTTNDGWKVNLRPHHRYELRLSRRKGKAWCYYTDEHFGPPSEVPRSKRM